LDFLVSAATLRAAVFAASIKSARPVEELARLFRVTPSLLMDPDARLSHARIARGWALLASAAGEPALGLVAAQLVDTATGDRLQPLLSQAETLGDAFETFLRYQQLYHSGNASRSRTEPGRWVLEFALDRHAEPCAYLADFVLANWLRRVRRAAGVEVPLIEARLRRPPPAQAGPYTETFGAVVRFGSGEDSLCFPRDVASLRIAGANAALRLILERQAASELDALDPDGAFVRDARAALELSLREGEANVEGLAKQLATSPRTLQRKLAACETTFQELLDQVRHELAIEHLARGQSVTDTAFLLGFSELSAFSRAFRRWTGSSPRSYRRVAAI
jgi:AraC-like DNA-binding protein